MPRPAPSGASEHPRPRLSLCVAGRRDNYGGKFLPRLEMCVNYLAHSARRAGCLDRIEWVCTDWNSDEPLGDALRLTPDAAAMARFLRVPPAMAEPHNPPDIPFNNSVSINVALRRARGDFLGLMPGDILLPAPTLERLLALLDNRVPVTFDPTRHPLAVPRRILPFDLREYTLPFAELDRYLERSSFQLYGDLINGSWGGCGIQLAHRDLWVRHRGYYERYPCWGSQDEDFFVRAGESGGFGDPVELTTLGVSCFDPRPAPSLTRAKRKRLVNIPLPIEREVDQPNWGLADQTIAEYHAAAQRPADDPGGDAPSPAPAAGELFPRYPDTPAPMLKLRMFLASRFVPARPPVLRLALGLFEHGKARTCLEAFDGRRLLYPVLARYKPSCEYRIVLPPAPGATEAAIPMYGIIPCMVTFHGHRGVMQLELPPPPPEERDPAIPPRPQDIILIPGSWAEDHPERVSRLPARLSANGVLLFHFGEPFDTEKAAALVDPEGTWARCAPKGAGFMAMTPPGGNPLCARLERHLRDHGGRCPEAGWYYRWIGSRLFYSRATRWVFPLLHKLCLRWARVAGMIYRGFDEM